MDSLRSGAIALFLVAFAAASSWAQTEFSLEKWREKRVDQQFGHIWNSKKSNASEIGYSEEEFESRVRGLIESFVDCFIETYKDQADSHGAPVAEVFRVLDQTVRTDEANEMLSQFDYTEIARRLDVCAYDAEQELGISFHR